MVPFLPRIWGIREGGWAGVGWEVKLVSLVFEGVAVVWYVVSGLIGGERVSCAYDDLLPIDKTRPVPSNSRDALRSSSSLHSRKRHELSNKDKHKS